MMFRRESSPNMPILLCLRPNLSASHGWEMARDIDTEIRQMNAALAQMVPVSG
jgi:hypothetical protein